MGCCRVRKDLVADELSVRTTDGTSVKDDLLYNYMWDEDDTAFFIFIDGEYREVVSVDFDFVD